MDSVIKMFIMCYYNVSQNSEGPIFFNFYIIEKVIQFLVNEDKFVLSPEW